MLSAVPAEGDPASRTRLVGGLPGLRGLGKAYRKDGRWAGIALALVESRYPPRNWGVSAGTPPLEKKSECAALKQITSQVGTRNRTQLKWESQAPAICHSSRGAGVVERKEG